VVVRVPLVGVRVLAAVAVVLVLVYHGLISADYDFILTLAGSNGQTLASPRHVAPNISLPHAGVKRSAGGIHVAARRGRRPRRHSTKDFRGPAVSDQS
jgi:hypothetical protein